MKRLAWLSSIPLLLALPAAALAADGYTTGNVNLRAGPDTSYPLLDTVPAGAPVDIQGCTSGWEWCDVVFQGERGWVAGNFIQYEYDDQDVLVPEYGARLGIPIVTFVIGSYWDRYYRDRPFYRERSRWYARPVPHRPPPPPPRHRVPPRHAAPYRPTPPHRPEPPHRPASPRPAPGHQAPSHPSPPHHARPPQAPTHPAPPHAGASPHPAPQQPQRPPAGSHPSHAPSGGHGKPNPHDQGHHGH